MRKQTLVGAPGRLSERPRLEDPSELDDRPPRIVVEGDQGAVEWTWIETDAKSGQQKAIDDAIIFTVHDNKITYWREYIDNPR